MTATAVRTLATRVARPARRRAVVVSAWTGEPAVESTDRRAIDFEYERQRHAGFVGRTDLLARLDRQLWNRLRRSGWSASELDAQLRVPEGLTALAVTPDGRHVVSASYDKTLKVWKLGPGRAVATLAGHSNWVTACVVTPDGRHVVSASEVQTLKVWEVGSRRAVVTLEGHISGVSACAVTPDGQHVVSASRDQTLKVWELGSGHTVVTLEGHTSGVTVGGGARRQTRGLGIA
ncbi:MAG TPA: hypothetical protein VF516_46055 [Kofleriaceae bacterium]